nr:MAG TPA: hypothetical protein [Caudoviricetes sp.]
MKLIREVRNSVGVTSSEYSYLKRASTGSMSG